MYPIIFLVIFASGFPSQLKTAENIDLAFINAKKGIYWGLSQSAAKQNSIKNNLIESDKLISAVRVEKEVNGLHIEAAGYYDGIEVIISIYKSTDNLIKEGFLVLPQPDTPKKTNTGRRRKN